jgi:hypothetical protein
MGAVLLSSRMSEASVGTYRPGSVASHPVMTLDPDTRSLRSLVRDDKTRRTVTLFALGAFLLAPTASAQRADVEEGIVLRIHPRVGDTLHTRLDQQTEVSAVVAGATKSVTTAVTLKARTIVQSSLPASTIVLTLVDSVDMRTSDAHGAAQVADAEKQIRGRQLVLQLTSDGTVVSARDPRGAAVPHDMAETMASMPAVFPHRPLSVGDQWTREMPLPAGGPLGTTGSGHVNAVFRLDSLDRSGNLAFVSMRGEIVPEGESQGVQLNGTVSGAMQVNRSRGWMTDSHFTVLVRSRVTPAPSTGLAPMRFVTRVTQRLRTMDKR